jgi:hypothetical protein
LSKEIVLLSRDGNHFFHQLVLNSIRTLEPWLRFDLYLSIEKMTYSTVQEPTPEEIMEAQKRVRKLKRFYKGLASWATTSVILLAINIFTTGGISWAKFPIFFWGISILFQAFEIFRLQRHDKQWEKRQLEKQLGRELPSDYVPMTVMPEEKKEDYSEELLNKEKPERQPADLSEFRKLAKPWKEDDLV